MTYPNKGYRIGSLPLPVVFGMRVPFDKLEIFGRALVSGKCLSEASRMARICRQTAYKFMRIVGIPQPVKNYQDIAICRKNGRLGPLARKAKQNEKLDSSRSLCADDICSGKA